MVSTILRSMNWVIIFAWILIIWKRMTFKVGYKYHKKRDWSWTFFLAKKFRLDRKIQINIMFIIYALKPFILSKIYLLVSKIWMIKKPQWPRLFKESLGKKWWCSVCRYNWLWELRTCIFLIPDDSFCSVGDDILEKLRKQFGDSSNIK